MAPRKRRRLIGSLRRAGASAGAAREPRRNVLMLLDRVAAVRHELLDLAARLEASPDPDPAAVEMLWRLLTDGCGSPLYNPTIHPSELAATLHYARERLTRQARTSATGDAIGREAATGLDR